MKNWQKWYNNLLQNKNSSQLQAFIEGFNGKQFLNNKYDYSEIKSSDSWQKLFSLLPYFPNFDFEYENENIISNNILFCVSLEKSIKTSNYSNIYPENIIKYIIFNRLKTTENLNDAKILKLLRELPYFWFDNCPNCDCSNNEGWFICKKCNCNIESSFDV